MSDDSQELFDHLDEVKKGKDPDYWEKLSREGKKNWSSFMIRRFLSMRMDYVPVLNELQPLAQHMDDKDVYRLYSEIIPYDDGFYKYISGSNSERKVPSWALDLTKKHFEVSEKEARQYIDIWLQSEEGKEEMLRVLKKYGVEDDKLKKVKQMR